MTQNLGMYQEVVPGAAGLGHMQRAMRPEDSTDNGIVQRIQQAVEQGMISRQAGQYLIENLMEESGMAANALRGMPGPQNMPPLENTFPYSARRGLLGE